MNPKTMAYIGVAAVLAIIAVWRLSGSDDSTLPNDPASASPWICEKCLNVIQLTPREVDRWVRDGKYLKQKDSLSKSLVFLCDKCGTHTNVRAEFCTTHNKHHPLYHPDGSGGICKECEEMTLKADRGG